MNIRHNDISGNSLFRALKSLCNTNSHFVLCDNHKKPVTTWRHYKPDSDLVCSHVERGGLIGLVPFSVGLTCLDIDQGDIENLKCLYDPCAFCPSRTSGRGHLYFRDTEGRANGKWHVHGCSGEIRSANGYVVLWGNAPCILADALSGTQGELFPVHDFMPVVDVPGVPAVDVPEPVRIPGDVPEVPGAKVGTRNNALYNAVRRWASARERPTDYDDWANRVLAYARLLNERMQTPLPESEILHVAGNVSKWIWTGVSNPKADHRAHAQRRRQRAQVRARRQDTYNRNRDILRLRQAGFSVSKIAHKIGVSASTVKRALR